MDLSVARKEEKWIKEHTISFSFSKDEFIPNPGSKIWESCNIDNYRNYIQDII